MRSFWTCLILIASVWQITLSDDINKPTSYKVVCYLGSWANYRQGDGKFAIEDIDASLCTHLIYGFAKLGSDDKITPYDPYLDLKENWGLGAYERFVGLKARNPSLKMLIAIGGWNEGSTKYSQMARDPSRRRSFVESCLHFLDKYHFDGLDLDWEYPAMRGGVPQDKQNFVQLLKELKEAFTPHNLMLTAAVSAGQNTVDAAYNVPAIAKHLDFISVMAYDFHGGWDRTTGHNSPLYARPLDSEEEKKLNVDYAVKLWLSKGLPSSKLILGMPLYGRTFALQNPQDTSLGAPVNGVGIAGPFTGEPGFVGYNEMCALLRDDSGWTVTRDDNIRAPFAVNGRKWVGYDDIQSIEEKVKYITETNLGGGMVWSIETDDFRGKCHGRKYPLLRTINEGLRNAQRPDYPDLDDENDIFSTRDHQSASTKFSTLYPEGTQGISEAPVYVTVQTPSTPAIDNTPFCNKAGYYRHPQDCKKFYLCQPLRPGVIDTDYQIYQFRCGRGTVFSEDVNNCAFPIDVPGCEGYKDVI